jgi:hypothetical protein
MARAPRYWKVNCMEDRYPGLWHTWYLHQVIAVGWPPGWRYFLEGKASKERGWSIARTCLSTVRPGDKVVVALREHRVGRVGEVVRLNVADDEWNPTVPPGPDEPYGEQGRQIQVRWELTRGPVSPDMVVRLPKEARLRGAKVRLTICELAASSFHGIERAMDDDKNWESILPQFDFERSLSDFIVSSPHRLEDRLVPYPSAKAREMVFKDGSRLDVLLLDHEQHPVVVECKQGIPRVGDIQQLRGYMRKAGKLRNLGNSQVRGILVHGGARKLPAVVRRESQKKPQVELVQHSVNVSFARST